MGDVVSQYCVSVAESLVSNYWFSFDVLLFIIIQKVRRLVTVFCISR